MSIPNCKGYLLGYRTEPRHGFKWSPHHKENNKALIAFISTYSNYDNKLLYDQLSIVDADGDNFRKLVNNPAWRIETLAWSPDGELIAFACSNQKDQRTDLYIVSRDGLSMRRLTNENLLFIFGLAWSPSGKQIVFSAGGEQSDIYIIDVDGNNLRRLTDGRFANTNPIGRPRK
jgi:Tol biopolymer transport system component